MIRHFEPSDLPLCMQEVRRYAQLKDDTLTDRLTALLPDALAQVHGRVCYDLFPVQPLGSGQIDLGFPSSPRSHCAIFCGMLPGVLFLLPPLVLPMIGISPASPDSPGPMAGLSMHWALSGLKVCVMPLNII